MKKTLAQLKRDLQKGVKLKVIYHAIRPERVGAIQEISKTQTNAICTLQERNGQMKDVYMNYPNSANLVEYIDNTFTFYEPGYRDLTEQEQELLNKMDNLSTKEEKMYDALTDGSTDYWRRKIFASDNKCEYLLGFEEKNTKI